MGYWYKNIWFTSGGSSQSFFKQFSQPIFVIPFFYNNVLFDENNMGYLYYYSKSTEEEGWVGNSTARIAQIRYGYNTRGRYAYRAGYSDYLITSSNVTLCKTGMIQGKFKLKSAVSYYPSDISGVYPIKFTLNGTPYKYFMLTGTLDNQPFPVIRGTQNTTSSSYMIGFFNNYSTVSSFELQKPSDFVSLNLKNYGNYVIDFGSPQEISQDFITWFETCFERVYENTYTIINPTTNELLATLTEAPPLTSANLTVVGDTKFLTVKGENDTNYTLQWTLTPPQGKIFTGLSTSKGGPIVIPVGAETPISINESTNFYEVYQTYRPPTTTFDINTYNYSGETSRVDKTDYLTPISTLSGVLRGESSLLNFNVIIQSDTVPNFNYCYIDKFKRYYYVTEPVSVRQNLWELTMQVDALMTYKDSLLKCEGYIDRNEYIQNKMIIDNNRAIMQGADFEEDTITNELFGSGSFVLSGLRIGTKEK